MLSVEIVVRNQTYLYRCRPDQVCELLQRIARDGADPRHPLTAWQAGLLQESLYQEAGDE